MKQNKIIFMLFFLNLFLTSQAKIYFDENGSEITRNNVVDIAVFFDKSLEENSAKEVKQYFEAKTLGESGVKPPKKIKNAITRFLIKSINQNELTIASNSLIRSLITYSEIPKSAPSKMLTSEALEALNNIADPEKFLIYKTPNGEFAILIPKMTYSDVITDPIDLTELGLNQDLIKVINTKEEIEDAFSAQLPTINIDVFINNVFSDDPEAKNIEKRVYAGGHGYFAPRTRIIGLKKGQYLSFLKKLKEVNCTFLYVKTCYYGGKNQLIVHKKQTGKHTSINELPIIVIGSLTDSTSTAYKDANFNLFFRDLNSFYQEPSEYFTKMTYAKIEAEEALRYGLRPTQDDRALRLAQDDREEGELETEQEEIKKLVKKGEWENLVLKRPWEGFQFLGQIIKHISGSIVQNTPSIKLFGQDPVAVELDDTIKIITQRKLLKAEIQQISLPKEERKFEVESTIKNLLLFPGIISIPIDIKSTVEDGAYVYPRIISMIPDKSHQFIKTMYVQIKEALDIIKFFSKFSHKKDAFPRLFFIKNLIFTTDTPILWAALGITTPSNRVELENVAIKTPSRKEQEKLETTHPNTIIFQSKNNKTFFKIDPADHFAPRPIDNEQTAKLEISKWIGQTKTKLKEPYVVAIERKVRTAINKSLTTIIPKVRLLKESAETPSEITPKTQRWIINNLIATMKKSLAIQKEFETIMQGEDRGAVLSELKTTMITKLQEDIRRLKTSINLINAKAKISLRFLKRYNTPLISSAIKIILDLLQTFVNIIQRESWEEIFAMTTDLYNVTMEKIEKLRRINKKMIKIIEKKKKSHNPIIIKTAKLQERIRTYIAYIGIRQIKRNYLSLLKTP